MPIRVVKSFVSGVRVGVNRQKLVRVKLSVMSDAKLSWEISVEKPDKKGYIDIHGRRSVNPETDFSDFCRQPLISIKYGTVQKMMNRLRGQYFTYFNSQIKKP
jgi:hypothetical protein